mgnify:CR=1 FL=1
MRAMCAKIQRGILTASAQITRRAALCETSLIKAPAVFARRIKLLGVEFYSFKRSTSLYKYKAASFKGGTWHAVYAAEKQNDKAARLKFKAALQK